MVIRVWRAVMMVAVLAGEDDASWAGAAAGSGSQGGVCAAGESESESESSGEVGLVASKMEEEQGWIPAVV